MDLEGRLVVITGASRGIGRALAHEFASAGSRVVLIARSEALLRELAAEVGGEVIVADLSDPRQLDGLIARVESGVGAPDVLVNNAAVEATALVDELEESTVEAQVALNLTAPIRLCRQVLPGMLARGAGHIVNVSSLAGVVPVPGGAVYGATKAALTHFSSNLGVDLRGTPVGVTCVEPGPVRTEMWERFSADPNVGAASRRFARLGLSPVTSAETVARATVRAVRLDRRSVRFPKRLLLQFWLEDAPRCLTRLVYTGMSLRRRGSSS